MVLPVENWTVEYFLTNQKECLFLLENLDFLENVANLDVLSLDRVKHGQLVKFQGMIQDMRNPEIFYENYVVKNSETAQTQIRNAKYKDMLHISPNEELVDCKENKNAERQIFIVISVPGLNNWTKQKATSESKKTFFNDIFDKSIETVNSKKRQHEDMEVDAPSTSNKKEKPESSESNEKADLILSTDHMLNFPVPIENGKSCIVKIYDEDTGKYKLNEVVDIVGFISLDPRLSKLHDSEEMYADMEIQTHHPPASIIPRLHAIKVTRPEKPTMKNDPETVKNIRMELHKVLSHLLFNDNLAADFLICHLISSIYKRNDYLCLGSFPLNITNFPATKQTANLNANEQKFSFPKIVYSFISAVLSKSVYLECSLENLNDLTFVPKKDYECDRLTSGVLQLSNNTHLVVDETHLSSGTVTQNGKINYGALNDVINSQKLNYDFKYYQMEYKTDIPVLILSEVSSFLEGTVRVPIQSNVDSVDAYSGIVSAVSMYLNDEQLLNRIRDYLYTLKFAEFTIDEEITNDIQEDLVKLKSSNANITAEDLHRCMVFSRLMALSYGSMKLTADIWKQSLKLEIERMERIERLPKSKKK